MRENHSQLGSSKFLLHFSEPTLWRNFRSSPPLIFQLHSFRILELPIFFRRKLGILIGPLTDNTLTETSRKLIMGIKFHGKFAGNTSQGIASYKLLRKQQDWDRYDNKSHSPSYAYALQMAFIRMKRQASRMCFCYFLLFRSQ